VQSRVREVELVRIRLPLIEPFRTARGTTTHKDALLVHVVTDDGSGWGEVGAEVAPTYAPDTLDTARLVLRDELVPRLFAGASLDEVRGHHPARGALAGALLDAELRATGESLASHLGGTRAFVDAGVAIGQHDHPAGAVAATAAFAELGYRSFKLKIAPGHDLNVVDAVRAELGPGIGLQVDANGSYALTDAEHLRRLDPLELTCFEQPLAPDALVDHARLAAQLQTPLCLDETITGARVARDAIELNACEIVSIKAGLVGGVHTAREIHDACVASGVGARAGGMLETGVGRAALIALASLPGFTITGDLSASNRYFTHDVTEPFVLDQGRIAVPTGAGLGVTPLPEMLARGTIAYERLVGPA
jgi:O-succinylbenzoate synthase